MPLNFLLTYFFFTCMLIFSHANSTISSKLVQNAWMYRFSEEKYTVFCKFCNLHSDEYSKIWNAVAASVHFAYTRLNSKIWMFSVYIATYKGFCKGKKAWLIYFTFWKYLIHSSYVPSTRIGLQRIELIYKTLVNDEFSIYIC